MKIKRLIFDLDETLIMWKSEYTSIITKSLKKSDNKEDTLNIDAVLNTAEKLFDTLSKESLLKVINDSCHLNLEISFIDDLLENQKKASDPNDLELQKTIKYLSKKYELVVLSNWFTETQKGRLEHAKILKYFSQVYGGDMIKLKPNKEAFLKALGNNKPEECIMIGDNLYTDINGAISLGINVIQVDRRNKIKEQMNHKVINKIEELMDIL